MKKKILFISYDGMTDPLGQSQVIPYLAGLSKYDYEFTILSCEKPKRFLQHKKHVEELLNSYRIKWSPLIYHKNPPALSSVYDVLALKKKVKKLHLQEQFHMVHTRAGIPSLIGVWMKKKFGVKFLHDVREFYADSRIEGDIWNYDNFFFKHIYNFFKRKEKEEIENSDGIVCLTYAAEKIIKAFPYYDKKIPIQVIPCSVDMELFSADKIDNNLKPAFEKELQINANDFIISYTGSIGSWYLTDEMIKFFKILLDKIPNAKFLFITPHHPDIILKVTSNYGIPVEKVIIKYAQRHEVPVLLSFSKYSVFFIKPCYSKKSASPAKHAEIMAMGIPVITNAGVGDVDDIIKKYDSGFVLQELKEEEYKKIAASIADENYFDKNKIRAGAKEFYNLENAIEKYKALYDNIFAV